METEIKKVNSLEELNKLDKGVRVIGPAASPFNSPIPRVYAGNSNGIYSFLNSLDSEENVTVDKFRKVIFIESEKIGDFKTKLREKTQEDRDLEKDFEVYFADGISDQIGYEIFERGTKKYQEKLKIIQGESKCHTM